LLSKAAEAFPPTDTVLLCTSLTAEGGRFPRPVVVKEVIAPVTRRGWTRLSWGRSVMPSSCPHAVLTTIAHAKDAAMSRTIRSFLLSDRKNSLTFLDG